MGAITRTTTLLASCLFTLLPKVRPFSHAKLYFRFFIVGPLNGVDKTEMVPVVVTDEFLVVTADVAFL